MIKMIAPKGKVIVSIPKSDDRLAQNTKETRQGILVAAGEDVSEEICNAVASHKAVAFFGKYIGELPVGDEKNSYLAMEEGNLYVVYPEGK